MKKQTLLSIIMLMFALHSFAGGLLTNTNQNATFLRNPAREAAIAIDGVYSNPAGIAFMPEGFHLSISWQAAWQEREITSTCPLYALGAANNGATTKSFTGRSKSLVIPSIQAAYVINDKWSVSGQFAIGGGGGKCEFNQGLGSFEALIGNTIYQATQGQAMYAFGQKLVGEQYIYGLQFGASYKLDDNLSLFAGLRGVLSSNAYDGSLTNITAITAAGSMPVSEDFRLDCEQSGFGVTPILGLDWKLENWNFAVKYEFRTRIELENEAKNSANVNGLFPAFADKAKVRNDIPSILTLGAEYKACEKVRIAAGYTHYYDTHAMGSATAVSDGTWEASLGIEWDINKKWTISGGVRSTNYGFEDKDMSDMSFNLNSIASFIGGVYKFNKNQHLNFGYMHSFYNDHDAKADKNGLASIYNRQNDVVGVSFDWSF